MKKEWIKPSLSEARRRTKDGVSFEYTLFSVDEDLKRLGIGKKYFIRTYGCQANERDGEHMAGILEEMKFQKTDDIEQADVILFNTCSIRENANNKVFGDLGNIKHLKQSNPDIIIGLSGCMAQEEVVINKVLESYHQVDLIFGTHNIYRLPQLLAQAILSKERTIEVYSHQGDIIENLPSTRAMSHKAWVNIIFGCDKFCTYCIVPFTRGKERSRKLEDVIEEVEALKEQGYKEVTLLGQNVNAYGRDLDMEDGFASLLSEVAKTGIDRVRFMTSHPWNFTEGMISAMAENNNIMPYLHFPLQSGNDDILRAMGRRYTQAEYLEVVHKLKSRIPNLAITTDIIVGFPNETEEQFEDTLRVYDEVQYDLAYTFIYSAREGTIAANLEDNVSLVDKKQRLYRLNEKVQFYSHKNNQQYFDTEVEVLVDGPSKKNPEVYSGYTKHNKVVNFPKGDAEIGQLRKVRINEAKSWFLVGELC